MAPQTLYNDLDLVPRGYRINPDWNRNFREDQDRRTKTIKGILDITLNPYVSQKNTMLSEVYFTKYWGVENYCLVYKINQEYHQIEVLIGAILESTDKVLEWFDLTTVVNFNIIIVTPHRTIVKTYFDLLYEYVTMGSKGRFLSVKDVINNHPRIQQMKEWVIRNPRYERVTQKTSLVVDPYSYRQLPNDIIQLLQLREDFVVDFRKKERMNQYIGGGQQMSYSIEQRVIERPKVDKEWVGKLNKLLKKLKLKL